MYQTGRCRFGRRCFPFAGNAAVARPSQTGYMAIPGEMQQCTMLFSNVNSSILNA